ncbi:MAG: TerB family tellurite resistance protein [Paludibacteraceae bacterium]
MTFTQNEMVAIFKLAKLMAAADGKVTNDERATIFTDLASFGVASNSLQSTMLEKMADEMEPTKAITIVANMTTEEKKYVCGYMAAVMVADGDIDATEQALWTLVSTLASFPTMNIAEAITFWKNN